MDTTVVSKYMTWHGRKRDRTVHVLWTEAISEEVEEVRSELRWVASLPPKAILMSGPGLLLGPMSGFMTLMQTQSLLMTMAPDATKGRKDRVIWSQPCPSLAATQGRTCPAHHLLKHSRERTLYLKRPDPICRGMVELALRA